MKAERRAERGASPATSLRVLDRLLKEGQAIIRDIRRQPDGWLYWVVEDTVQATSQLVLCFMRPLWQEHFLQRRAADAGSGRCPGPERSV